MAWWGANKEDVRQVSGSWALMRVELKPICLSGATWVPHHRNRFTRKDIPIHVNVTYVTGEPAAILNVPMSVL